MQYINTNSHLYIAKNIDSVLCISSQMLKIYIVLHILFCTHINGIISFSTFCQSHWQESRPTKSVRKSCHHFEDRGTDLRHVVLILLWQLRCSRLLFYLCKKESFQPSSLLSCCKFLDIILQERTSVVRSSTLIWSGVAIDNNFSNDKVILSMNVQVSKKDFLSFCDRMMSCQSY